jgi:hypothetical protein
VTAPAVAAMAAVTAVGPAADGLHPEVRVVGEEPHVVKFVC